MALLQRLAALHTTAERERIPVDELRGSEQERRREPRAERGSTRRELLAAAGAIAAAAGLPARAAGSVAAHRHGPAPRIAIVGAGLAGLRCAHLLWNGGAGSSGQVASTVYEANPDRAGGRCWTLRGYFSDGLETEHGGSFLNSNQRAVRELATLLGLSQEIVDGGDLPEGEEVFYIGGAPYTLQEANADWANVGFETFKAAARELQSEEGERRLDNMSVPEWLESTEIGTGSRFGRLMLANTVTENGGDPADQSALDLIELLDHNHLGSVVPLAGDDERFHIVGGNDQLVSRMLEQLPAETLQPGHVLVALRQNSDDTITLSFEVSGSMLDVNADFVVLALPFSTLREVDLSGSGLPPQKLEVIHAMGMGSNAKVRLELSHKTWPGLGFSGATYGEWQRLACAWDDCVQLGPDASPALFVAFPGAEAGASGLTGAAHGPAPAADAEWALGELEHVFPGTTEAFTGRAYEDHWALDPWVKGAYSYYRVGQASTYGRLARAENGRYLFAGEHTSIANIGFLDGAVATGERAARRLLKRA